MKFWAPKYDKAIVLAISLSWAIAIAVLSHCFYAVQFFDGALRYASQAEYFADGNWFLAFHPRFGILFQTLAGTLVWLFNIDGLFAGQLIASFSLCAAAFAFYVFASSFSNRFTAWMVFLFVLTCPTFNSWSANGLRESTRALFAALFLIGFAGVFLKNRNIKLGGLWLNLSLAIPILLQSHAFAPCWAITLVLTGILVIQRRYRLAILLFLAEIVVSVIICTMIWFYTGWFVPAIQYIKVLKAIGL